jgi:hypothetical protein
MARTRTASTATCIAAVTALAAVAVAAPAADAKPKNTKHKGAVYELTLKGSEALTWHYEAPADGCFYGATGNGSQELTYNTGKIKVKAVRPKSGDRKGQLQLTSVKDRLAQYGFVTGIEAVAHVEREGEIKSSAGCGGTGHSTQQPPPPDCGLRHGRLTLLPGYQTLRSFQVQGKYDNFGRPVAGETDDLIPPPVAPHSGEPLSATYQQCPILLPDGMAARNDEMTPASKSISQLKVLPKKGKTIKLSAGDRETYADSDGQRTGETSVAWNLKLKRIK